MDRREAVITGVVIGLTCLAITLMTVVARGSSSTEIVAPPVERSQLPDDVPDGRSELDVFVDEAIAFIEAERDRPFLTRPDVVILSDAEFTDRVQDDIVEDLSGDPEELAASNAFYRSLGLVDPDDDLVDVYAAFGAAGVLGFYDPSTDELVVRQRDDLSLLTKSTIVHELVHAYDDQHFDLDREGEYADRTDEIAWTFRAVAEGSASWVEERWKATLSESEQDALFAEEFEFSDPTILTRFTLSFLLLEISPYEHGEPFIDEQFDVGGNPAIDEVLTTPPDTSEQVMEPDRFADGEGALPLDVPPADGEVLHEGVGGAVLLEALLQGNGIFFVPDWGADQLVVWESDDGRSCVRWHLRPDRDRDLDGLRDTLDQWGDAVGGTEVTLEGDVVQLDRCA